MRRASKGLFRFLPGAKAAERSGPSSSSPSASSPSKLSDSSDALAAADGADAGGSGSSLLKAREDPALAVLATSRVDQSAEAVHSPPVAASGCLGMFKRGKSEEVTIRGFSQPLLTAGMPPVFLPPCISVNLLLIAELLRALDEVSVFLRIRCEDRQEECGKTSTKVFSTLN